MTEDQNQREAKAREILSKHGLGNNNTWLLSTVDRMVSAMLEFSDSEKPQLFPIPKDDSPRHNYSVRKIKTDNNG